MRSNYTTDLDDKKNKMTNEKAEIDLNIKLLNKKIQEYKEKNNKINEINAELEPYLEKQERKKSKRKENNSKIDTKKDDFFKEKHKFDDMESLGDPEGYN